MQPDQIEGGTAAIYPNNTGIERATISGIRCVKSRYGVYLKNRWTDATFHFCVFGRYGTVLSDILNNMQADFTFIDVGANQGLYSLIAARNPACQKVYAFEPVANTYQYLLDNVLINQAHKIVPVNAAISDKEGTGQIAVQRGHSGAATLREFNPLLVSRTDTIRTIDGSGLVRLLAEANNCIIKIDVEGFESTVLDQLEKAGVLERAETLFYEIDEKWTDPAEIESRLRLLGFKGFVRSGSELHYDVMATRNDQHPLFGL